MTYGLDLWMKKVSGCPKWAFPKPNSKVTFACLYPFGVLGLVLSVFICCLLLWFLDLI